MIDYEKLKLFLPSLIGVNHVDTQYYPQPLRVVVHMDVTVCG